MQKVLKILFFILLICFVFYIAGYYWLYKTNFSPSKLVVLQNLPIAVGSAGNQKIYVSDLVECQKFNKQILAVDKKLIECFYDIVNQKQTLQILENLNIEIPQEKLVYLTKWLKSQDPNFQNTLNKYNLDQANFQKWFISEYFNLINLKVWYNTKEQFNKIAYNSAKQAISDLNNKKSFRDIALAYSTDEFAQKLNGDNGYVSEEKILPEILEVLQKMSVGETKIIPSREGVNIVKLESVEPATVNDTKKYKIKSLTFQTNGFEDWLYQEKQKILVYQFIKIN